MDSQQGDDNNVLQDYTAAAVTAEPGLQPATSPLPSSPKIPVPRSPSRLFKLAILLALLVGAGITASTTYALVKRVQHLVATAAVDPNPQTWMLAARTQVYDPCYLGCDDCKDPSYAWNACQRTVQLPINQAVICDGNRMWNWKERYPEHCLDAMGKVLQAEALERKKQSYRNQLAIIILTIFGGVVGAIGTYVLTKSWTTRRDRKAAMARANPPPYRKKPLGAGKARLKILLAASLALFGRKAEAYACTGYDPSSNQFFINPNGTISGVVHGWFSNCYDKKNCYPLCTPVCSGIKGVTLCTVSCTTSCYTTTYSDKPPVMFVQDMARKVETCGFRLVDAVQEGMGATTRIANANIERNYWVKILVNGFNVTHSNHTDEMVLCLHDIGGR